MRAAAVVAVVLGLDQISKALVRAHVAPGSRGGIIPGVDLVNTRNTGVAFSLFQDSGVFHLSSGKLDTSPPDQKASPKSATASHCSQPCLLTLPVQRV